MSVYTEGLQSGTLAANLLLAEIPPDAGGVTGQAPQILISASVGATVEFQVRNAANSANVWAHRMFILAANPCVVVPPPSTIILQASERLRIVLISGILGSVQATMF